jgi:uncharacterized membrane protein YqhA
MKDFISNITTLFVVFWLIVFMIHAANAYHKRTIIRLHPIIDIVFGAGTWLMIIFALYRYFTK